MTKSTITEFDLRLKKLETQHKLLDKDLKKLQEKLKQHRRKEHKSHKPKRDKNTQPKKAVTPTTPEELSKPDSTEKIPIDKLDEQITQLEKKLAEGLTKLASKK
ncbi:MAG: hypothetical protein Hyperionvirus15_23 [Hyperionvirus sp.]|uniref:Uncharacterized protein n=1 Tax=Hyperionvirus sp. TaxID=2487770 RepID=A0A3G5A9S4_9VIRU|nr:MAG: hypothetical protein Hyperionvirus15_23 [Hyperionvirus sp.]